MTIDPTTYASNLSALLEIDMHSDPEGGEHAQRAKALLDGLPRFIAALSAPIAPLDREDLLDLGMIEQCVRRLGQRAQDKARQG